MNFSRPVASHRSARLHAESCLAKPGAQGVARGITQCTNVDRPDHPEEPDAHPPRSAIYREYSRHGKAAGKTAADLIQGRMLPCRVQRTSGKAVSRVGPPRLTRMCGPAEALDAQPSRQPLPQRSLRTALPSSAAGLDA